MSQVFSKKKYNNQKKHKIMIKNKYWAIPIFILLSLPIFPQGLNSNSGNGRQLLTKQPFSLKDYKSLGETISDTIWLPQRQDIYLWNGVELEINPVYHLLFYNNPDEMSTLITMDSNTNDSLLMATYEYDEQSMLTDQVFYIYDTVFMGWKTDYKAILTYDGFGCVNRILLQGLNTQTGIWHDSIARLDTYVDTNEIILTIIKEYISPKWDTIWAHHWDYHYTPEGYVDLQNNYLWNTDTKEWVDDVQAFFLLNDDGSWYESEWQRWDQPTQEWINTQKYTDVEWEAYNKYPNNYKNLTKHRVFQWWVGDEWYTYLKDDWEYPSPGLDDRIIHAYAWDGPSSEWYKNHYYISRHYPDNRKRRYTDSLRNSIHEEMKLNYDDSCRWFFYKGALEEMFRVNYDTAQAEWIPAAKLLYSDFTPFVDDTGLDETLQKSHDLKIIPNPATNSIEIINEHQFEKISVFDGNGRLMTQLEKQENIPKIKIDISKLPRGTYIVRAISSKKHVYSEKLMVN